MNQTRPANDSVTFRDLSLSPEEVYRATQNSLERKNELLSSTVKGVKKSVVGALLGGAVGTIIGNPVLGAVVGSSYGIGKFDGSESARKEIPEELAYSVASQNADATGQIAFNDNVQELPPEVAEKMADRYQNAA